MMIDETTYMILSIVLAALLTISEVLGLLKKVEANSILDLFKSLLLGLKEKEEDRPLGIIKVNLNK